MIDQIKSNWGEEDLYGMTGRLMKSIMEKSISSDSHTTSGSGNVSGSGNAGSPLFIVF